MFSARAPQWENSTLFLYARPWSSPSLSNSDPGQQMIEPMKRPHARGVPLLVWVLLARADPAEAPPMPLSELNRPMVFWDAQCTFYEVLLLILSPENREETPRLGLEPLKYAVINLLGRRVGI